MTREIWQPPYEARSPGRLELWCSGIGAFTRPPNRAPASSSLSSSLCKALNICSIDSTDALPSTLTWLCEVRAQLRGLRTRGTTSRNARQYYLTNSDSISGRIKQNWSKHSTAPKAQNGLPNLPTLRLPQIPLDSVHDHSERISRRCDGDDMSVRDHRLD